MHYSMNLFCRETGEVALFERYSVDDPWSPPEQLHAMRQDRKDGDWLWEDTGRQVCRGFRDRGDVLRGAGAPALEAHVSYEGKTRFLKACRRLGYTGPDGVPSSAKSASTVRRRMKSGAIGLQKCNSQLP